MPIVGFHFTHIQAKKKNNISESTKVNIASRLSITDVQKEKLPTGKTKTDGLKIFFDFGLDYQPDIANISFEGFIYYLDDAKVLADITKEWVKQKNIPLDVKTQVLNSVILKGTVRALALEQEINLPPHLPFPSIQPAKRSSKDEYIG